MIKNIIELKTNDPTTPSLTLVKSGRNYCLADNGKLLPINGVSKNLLSTFVKDHVTTVNGIPLTGFKKSADPLYDIFLEYYYLKVKDLDKNYQCPATIEQAYSDYLLVRELDRQGITTNTQLKSNIFGGPYNA